MSAEGNSQKSPRFAFPDLTDQGVPMPMVDMMQMISQLQGKMVDCMLRQNVEMLEFLKNRVEKDRALFAELGKNKDPSTALQQWSDFWQKAMTDYSNESGKLTATVAETVETVIGDLSEESKALAGKMKVAKG